MAAAKERPAPSERQSYTWSFPGAPVRIQLSLEVVQRLAPCFPGKDGALPFGLLLGHVDGPTTIVSGFHPLASSEITEIETALAELTSFSDKPSVVGYYRAQPQEGLRLDENDLALAEAYFYDPSNVILVVQAVGAGASNATFFFWDGGRLNGDVIFLEFPFDASLLTAAEQRRVEAAQRRSFEVLPSSSPVPAKPRRALWKGAAWTLLVACLGGGAVLGSRFFLEKSQSPSKQPVPASPSHAAAEPAPQPSIGLHAERQNADLQLTWDRGSPVIVQATSAVLSIEDGEARRTIPLHAAQVHTGSILYTPVSDQVQMELAVTTPSESATESVLVLLPKKGPVRTVAILPPVLAQSSQSAAPKSTSPIAPAKPFTAPPASPRKSAPVVPLSEPPALAVGSSPPAVADTSPWSRPSFNFQPPATPSTAATELKPQRTPVSAPVYRGARPVHKVQPTLRVPLRNLSSKVTAVEVMVAIDESGKVVKAEPQPQPGVNPVMMSAALQAARQWTFDPARRGDQPVASEMLLRFNFAPGP